MSLFHVFLIVSQAPLTFIGDIYSDFVWRTVIEDEEVYDIYVANKYLTYKVLMDYYENKKWALWMLYILSTRFLSNRFRDGQNWIYNKVKLSTYAAQRLILTPIATSYSRILQDRLIFGKFDKTFFVSVDLKIEIGPHQCYEKVGSTPKAFELTEKSVLYRNQDKQSSSGLWDIKFWIVQAKARQ